MEFVSGAPEQGRRRLPQAAAIRGWEAADAAILGGEDDPGATVRLAEIAAVFEQTALLASEEAHREPGHRSVGNALEAGSYPSSVSAFDRNRVDEADQDHVDRPMEVGDDVGEFPFAAIRSEVDRTLERLIQERGYRGGLAQDRELRQLPWLNWTRVHGLLMWLWSMNSLVGSITLALAVFAWPRPGSGPP